MNKAIYIKWIDSASTEKWMPVDSADGKICLIESIGWLVREHKYTVEITSSWDSASGSILGVLAIPKCAILKRHYLKDIKRKVG